MRPFWRKTVPIEGQSAELLIWDTAGQEQYRSVTKMYFRDAKLAFVCVVQEDIPAFQTWAKFVIDTVSDCRIFAVLTKCDLVGQEKTHAVEVQLGEAAAEFNGHVHLTSADTGEGSRPSSRPPRDVPSSSNRR
jgi:GTPase SAR1 family protein